MLHIKIESFTNQQMSNDKSMTRFKISLTNDISIHYLQPNGQDVRSSIIFLTIIPKLLSVSNFYVPRR